MKNTYLVVVIVMLSLMSCQEEKSVERPSEVWVFRSVLDDRPRMVTAALSDQIWVSYDARTASLYKAWKGGVNFDGAVYTTVHGPQPTSKGYAYYTDEVPDKEWFVLKDGVELLPEVQYKGHRFVGGQVQFMYQLTVEGQHLMVYETPEAIARGKQNGLFRKFEIEGAGDYQVGLQVTVTSLVSDRDLLTNATFEERQTEEIEYEGGTLVQVTGKLLLKGDEPTELKAYYHQGFDLALEGVAESEEPAIPPGVDLIERSDCHACHNEEVKTVGPAYMAIARKYSDQEETVTMLANKIIKGGNGIWGQALMSPHPDLSEEDAADMVRYILSLDDQDENNEENAWHLGVKTVTPGFAGQVPKPTEGTPGLSAYLYIHSGDSPNFEALKEEDPFRGAIIPQLHLREASDFGDREQQFAMIVKGTISPPKTGSYSFRLWSDDGSFLYIDGKQVIDNGGFHGVEARDGEVYLTEGAHDLEIHFYQGGGGAAVSFQWFNTDLGNYEVVPQEYLSTSANDYHEVKPYLTADQLIKSIPGDQRWLSGVHPSFDIFQARPDDFQPRVGGIDFLSADEMLVCTWDSLGPVYLVENFRAKDPAEIKVRRIAAGLAEPLGIKVVDGEIYVLQKQELTKLIDHDGDGLIDEYQTIADDWAVSSNFHEFSFGLVYQDGYFYGALATDILPGGASANPQPKDRGKVIKISKETGEVEFVASGLRTPNGIGIGVDGEIFVADNQGDWLPASKINHVRPGAWYGSRSVDMEGTEGQVQDEPVVWLPQDEIGNSPSTPLYLDKGPYAGQMIHCEVTHGGVKRVFVEKINGNYQGAVFRFSQGIEAGVNRLAWAPDGSLIAGGIGVSGNWGQTGKLNYGLQRLVYNGQPAFEMLKVMARSDGFEIEFTQPIKVGQVIAADNFQIEQFYFKPSPEYGGPKLGLETLTPTDFSLSADRRKVAFKLDGLQEKHVVYFRIKRPFVSSSEQELWTTEAWYTLTNIPEDAPVALENYSVSHNTLTDAERLAGYTLLFDGQSIAGLRNYNQQTLSAKWKARMGALVFDPNGNGTGGDVVITDKAYQNYELVLDWKISEGGNSGIIYQVIETDAYDYPWLTGPEYQLLDNTQHADGQIEKHRAGDLYDMISTKFVTVNPVGEWNSTILKVKDGHVEHWLNGYKVVEYNLWDEQWNSMVAASKFKEMPDFGTGKEGHVVLQDHGDQVWFRNIKIREL